MESGMIQGSPSSSSSTSKWKYNVFVSFRGEDIRNTFADHLFGAFESKGIKYVFRDDSDIKHGDHISTELMQAIEGSQVLIPIFSKNYATSTWCLRELAKIVECKNWEAPTGRRVLPVFYDVSPSEVRKQSGDYGEAFAEHEARFNDDPQMVQSWRKALQEVADLSGSPDVQNKPQHKEIQKIVESVKDLLDHQLSGGFDGLVGMQSRVEQLEELSIDSNDDVRVVGVCGMGGIGKTTLVTKVYERNYPKYGAPCFIAGVRDVYRNGGLLSVQRLLIDQTLREEKTRVLHNSIEAKDVINTRLCHRKALIVLDDVDNDDQLITKLGLCRERLCPGSRIILTSRNRHSLSNNGVDKIYDVKLLDDTQAHQLFCEKAFGHTHIMSSDANKRKYEQLTRLALKHVRGLPLAIVVLGLHLRGKTIAVWESALERLNDNPQSDIMDVLKISFDGLESDEKDIFLDIACFSELSYSCHIGLLKVMLQHREFPPDAAIQVLIDKSLVYDEHEPIRMHDMLRNLGKKIIREQAPNKPRMWSRIWCLKDFRTLMFEEEVMKNIEVVSLVGKVDDKEGASSLRANALSKMNHLRLLIVEDVEFSGSLDYLSKELRYLEWDRYPFEYLPSSCELINLAQLSLRNSSIRQLWEGFKPLYKLRFMNLNFSKNLVRIPDLSGAPNLEKLYLEGCTNLEEIHPSIGDLRKLVHLDLRDCTSLTSLPNSIFNATSLIHVNLEGCSKAFHTQLSGNARHIGTSDTTIQWQLSASSLFNKIKLIMLPFSLHDDSTRQNDIVGSQMPSLARCYCLRYLNLSYCSLVNIPESLASLCCLKELFLEGNNFLELPSFIAKLPRLVLLRLDHCKQLASISEFPLRTDFQAEESKCIDINFFGCNKLVDMESLSSSAFSRMIQVLKVNKESSPKIAVIIPGITQIPSWFNRQSVEDSISIGPFPNVHDSNWIGIAYFATFAARYFKRHGPLEFLFAINCIFENQLGFKKGCRLIYIRIHDEGRNEVTNELDHVCLFYFTRQELTHKDEYVAYNTNYTFHFSLECKPEWENDRSGGYGRMKVKNCGVRVVFKKDLEEFVGEE